MSLAQDLLQIHKPEPKPLCKVGVLLTEVDENSAAVLTNILADKTVTTAAIFRVLASNEIQIGWSTIQRHREHFCACPIGPQK